MLKTWFRCTFSVSSFRVFKKWHDVIRPRSLVPSTNLSLQRIGDFEKARDNSLLVKKCYAKKGVISSKQSRMHQTPGSNDVMSLFKNAKAWNWERASKPGFQHSISNTFLLHFKCISLQTLDGL